MRVNHISIFSYKQAVNFCSEALKHLPDICAPKMLRAKAEYKLKQYGDAHSDLEEVLAKTSDNKKAAALLNACENKIRYRF
jgi:hypothetical protein